MPDVHPDARWSLPEDPDLGWLRKRAKELRRAATDPDDPRHDEAVDLLVVYDPGDGPVTLARAQRVLARAFGFAGWSRLVAHLEVVARHSRPMAAVEEGDEPTDEFLRLACLSYTEPGVADRALALLRADESLVTASAYTLAACAEAGDLAVLLATDPGVVSREGGPHRWPPLLYLCYSRLGVGDPVTTLRVLLDAGADPDSGFLWKGFPSAFTALTGVLGGGERGEAPHPQSVALARMLLAAGADPNDNQAFYNRMFEPDDSHLPPLLEHGAGHPHPSPWRERLGAEYPSPEEMVGEHLRSGAEYGYTARVRLLLAHGVDPNTRGYHPILGDLTAYEVAVRNGQVEAAALLATAGGASDRIDDADRLVAAALAGEPDTVEALRAHADAAVRRRPEAMRYAAERHGRGALERLLDLGFGVNDCAEDGRTSLHQAAGDGDIGLCRWLVEHGADREARDRDFDSTPSGWAEHGGFADLAAELDPATER